MARQRNPRVFGMRIGVLEIGTAAAAWYFLLGPGKGKLPFLPSLPSLALPAAGLVPLPPTSSAGIPIAGVIDYPLSLLSIDGQPTTWSGGLIRNPGTNLAFVPGRDVFRDTAGYSWLYLGDGATLTALEGPNDGQTWPVSAFYQHGATSTPVSTGGSANFTYLSGWAVAAGPNPGDTSTYVNGGQVVTERRTASGTVEYQVLGPAAAGVPDYTPVKVG